MTDYSTLDPKTKQHVRICAELIILYHLKNADYGDSFHQTFIEEGMSMARVRLSDKLNRFKQLTRDNSQRVADESIRDTLLDLANYAIMTIMEMDAQSQPAEEPEAAPTQSQRSDPE